MPVCYAHNYGELLARIAARTPPLSFETVGSELQACLADKNSSR